MPRFLGHGLQKLNPVFRPSPENRNVIFSDNFETWKMFAGEHTRGQRLLNFWPCIINLDSV
jgi:hypothetical protein